MASPPTTETDLLVIGGGASGTAILRSVAAVGRPRRVILLERSEVLGPGYPYGATAAPFHTMGRTPTLRHTKGEQLRARFAGAVQRLRSHGIEVELRTGTTATGIQRSEASWRVETKGGEIVAPAVVIATGHWHTARLAHLRRAVDWRWDVRRLIAEVRDDEDVVIVGMGQSGLDAATTLGERRRGLARAGRIHLVSRTGLLPAVFGHVSSASAGESTRHLAALTHAATVSLSDIVAATRADTEAVAVASAPGLPRWDLAALAEHARTPDTVALFRRELGLAEASLAEKREIPWHPVLWHGMHFFHPLMARLNAEDRLLLASWWTPVMRHLEAIHAGAARRILELVDLGLLAVHRLGEGIALSEDGTGVRARGALGEAHGQRLVDCRGPDPRLERSDDGFLQAVFATGAAAAGRARFDGPPPASVPAIWSVEHRADADWLITGGLWVDPQNFAVRDADGRTHGLYALGPLTLGQFPFYAGLWASSRAAERIVASL